MGRLLSDWISLPKQQPSFQTSLFVELRVWLDFLSLSYLAQEQDKPVMGGGWVEGKTSVTMEVYCLQLTMEVYCLQLWTYGRPWGGSWKDRMYAQRLLLSCFWCSISFLSPLGSGTVFLENLNFLCSSPGFPENLNHHL